jgi:uncharacterized membrane protein YedE/YeeE
MSREESIRIEVSDLLALQSAAEKAAQVYRGLSGVGGMQQDWLWGLAGGGLIGLSASVYLLVNGRVMGASGILGGLVDGSAKGEAARERTAFIVGLLLAPGLIVLARGGDTTDADGPVILYIAAGLLVGLGTRLANGCTSGHGVSGISRLSVRGIVATLIYIAAGGIAVFLLRHLTGVL